MRLRSASAASTPRARDACRCCALTSSRFVRFGPSRLIASWECAQPSQGATQSAIGTTTIEATPTANSTHASGSVATM